MYPLNRSSAASCIFMDAYHLFLFLVFVPILEVISKITLSGILLFSDWLKKLYVKQLSNPIRGLYVYTDKFKYKQNSYDFSDIQHIGWRHSNYTFWLFNFNKYTLSIHLESRAQPVIIKSLTMYFTSMLVDVNDYLSKMTYDKRFGFYYDQLNSSGKILYANHNIFSNGKVDNLKSGHSFNLRNTNVNLFNDGIDADVISILLKNIISNPVDPDVYRNSHLKIIDIVILMANISDEKEKSALIVEIFLKETLLVSPTDKLMSIFYYSLSNKLKFKNVVNNVYSRCKDDKELLNSILDLLFLIVTVGGKLTDEKETLLIYVQDIFKMKCSLLSKYKPENIKIKNRPINYQYKYYLNGSENPDYNPEIND